MHNGPMTTATAATKIETLERQGAKLNGRANRTFGGVEAARVAHALHTEADALYAHAATLRETHGLRGHRW